jgi:hypothetical protein
MARLSIVGLLVDPSVSPRSLFATMKAEEENAANFMLTHDFARAENFLAKKVRQNTHARTFSTMK